jgi:UDP-N-acetylglucosamine 2-epimerase/N-acetylmannosamine kinase
VDAGNFIIVSHHPVTSNVEASLKEFDIITDAILQMQLPTLLIFPNVDAGSKEMVRIARLKGIEQSSFVTCHKHVPFETYMLLLATTRCLVGNSSAGIREAGAYGTPSINIGTRQTCREHGESVLDLPSLTLPGLVEAIQNHGGRRFEKDLRYGRGDATEMMLAHMKRANVADTQKRFEDH